MRQVSSACGLVRLFLSGTCSFLSCLTDISIFYKEQDVPCSRYQQEAAHKPIPPLTS